MKEVYKYRNVTETGNLWNDDNVIALICLNLLASLACVFIILIQSSNMILGSFLARYSISSFHYGSEHCKEWTSLDMITLQDASQMACKSFVVIEKNVRKSQDDDSDGEYILVFMDFTVVFSRKLFFSLLYAFPFK